MNKILESIAVHAYLDSSEYKNAETERHRKMDDEFVRNYIVDVVGTAVEGGFSDEIV